MGEKMTIRAKKRPFVHTGFFFDRIRAKVDATKRIVAERRESMTFYEIEWFRWLAKFFGKH